MKKNTKRQICDWATYDNLYELYSVQGKTIKDIAQLYNVSFHTANYYIMKHSLIRKPNMPYKPWKGGKTTGTGYVLILCPNHPFANHCGYIAEHRLIMEAHLGRYLTKEEEVHHKNKIRNDNRLENLELFSNRTEHLRQHRRENPRPKNPITGKFV